MSSKNKLFYNASMVLVQTAVFVKEVDEKFAKKILDKAQEYADQITVDDEIEKEVNEFEQKIKEGI